MGYSSEYGKNAAQGGPFEDSAAVVRKGNSSRPQNWTGKYVTDIPGNLSRPSDDGREHPGIAPKQGFRKELPPAAKSSGANESTTDMDGAMRQGPEPSFDKILDKWR